MKKLLLGFTILASSLTINTTQAALFSITCNSGTAVCNAIEPVRLKMENDINADLPDADASNYLKGMANASVMSNKANGTDYADDIDVFVVGVGVGLGADVGNNSFGDLIGGDIDGEQLRGIGVQPSLLVGLNLGLFNLPMWGEFDPNKVKVFLNFFTYDKNDAEVTAELTNFGVHFRYKFYDPVAVLPGKLVHWTGVDISTGFEYSKLNLAYTTSKSTTYTEGAFNATITGNLLVGAEVTTMSIPVEVSTGVQLGYVLSLYTGLGADLNFGSAEAKANVNAPITASNGASLTGALDLGQEASPTTITPRGFFGFQINVPFVKLYVQLDKMLAESAYGLGTGVRVTW